METEAFWVSSSCISISECHSSAQHNPDQDQREDGSAQGTPISQ